MEEMKVKIEVKAYKCEYCGKQHLSIPERTKCEFNCEAEQKRKDEQERVQKILEEKQTDYNEIQELLRALNTKLKSYKYKYNENLRLIDKHLIFGSLL